MCPHWADTKINHREKKGNKHGSKDQNDPYGSAASHYDPLEKDATKQYVLNKERIEYWVGQGADASDTCAQVFKKQLEITCPQYEAKLARRARARAIARKLDKPFTEAERIAAAKAIEDAANAEAKAAEEAAAAAKAAEEKA
ncbi:MAG: hypothetical protein ACYTCN_10780, partial [Planctomycetota bacterium]